MLQWPVEDVEAICDEFTRQGACIAAQEFLTWPDGTATVRYGFRHVLYREVLYERLGMAQRARWHRLVAERFEAGYGSRARELAGELALHFERGQDARRAVQYRQYAAEQALSRSAYTEALATLPQGAGPARDPARQPRTRLPGTHPAAGLEHRPGAHPGPDLGGAGAQSAASHRAL